VEKRSRASDLLLEHFRQKTNPLLEMVRAFLELLDAGLCNCWMLAFRVVGWSWMLAFVVVKC